MSSTSQHFLKFLYIYFLFHYFSWRASKIHFWRYSK